MELLGGHAVEQGRVLQPATVVALEEITEDNTARRLIGLNAVGLYELLDALAGTYNSDDFMVLPINLDIGENGLGKAEQFLAENQFTHLPLYADNSFAAFDRLKQEAVAVGLPATLILDKNGCELAVLQGPAEWNTPDGEAVVKALLGTYL